MYFSRSICEKNVIRSLVREFRNKMADQLVLKMLKNGVLSGFQSIKGVFDVPVVTIRLIFPAAGDGLI